MAKLMRKKKATRVVSRGRVYIRSSFNNTIITATDATGGTIAWVSAGSLGFVGAYNTAIQVRSQPADRDLPPELVDKLKADGYVVDEMEMFSHRLARELSGK